jgi:hypothetical protein
MDISAAYSGLKFAKDSLTTIVKTKIDNDTQLAITGILERLGQAQDVLFELRDKLANLQNENHQLKDELQQIQGWNKTAENYELTKTPGGAVVYKYTSTPVHHICPSCFEKKEIHILQDRKVATGIHDCPNCKASFPIDKQKELGGEVFQVHSKWDDL